MSAASPFSSSSFSLSIPYTKPSSKFSVGVAMKTNLSSFKSQAIKVGVEAPAPEVVQDGPRWKQSFFIYSYGVGPDGKANIETLLNLLQETSINLAKGGQSRNGFSATPEMIRIDLVWVFTKMQFVVESYPYWGDLVQVDIVDASCGRSKVYFDCHVYNNQTKKTFMRATISFMAINKQTRRFSRIPEDVKTRLRLVDHVVVEDKMKMVNLTEDTADYVKKDLRPKWSDMDVNHHVNNAKYISWIFESVPMWLQEQYELTSMSLEYRRECGRDNVLESLTAFSTGATKISLETKIECEHTLRLDYGVEVLRARSQWCLKSVNLSKK